MASEEAPGPRSSTETVTLWTLETKEAARELPIKQKPGRNSMGTIHSTTGEWAYCTAEWRVTSTGEAEL